MKKSNLAFVALSVASSIAITHPAYAQTVDYGSLQELFQEPITTSATGTPQRASEVAANMTIVTADQIRQSGSRSIPQILNVYVPGIDVLQEGANTWDIGVRGYQQPYQPRLLVLLDGRQVFNDDYSRMNWDNLPVNIDDVRQIEVVKGASSALFGSNATGGVVNIITYSPLYDKNNVASIGLGTQNTFTGDATVTLPIKGIGGPDNDFGGIKVSGGGLNMDEFQTSRPSGEAPTLTTHPYHRYVSENSVTPITKDFQITTETNFSEKNGEEAIFVNSLTPVKTTTYSVGGGFGWQTPFGLIKNNNYLNHFVSKIATAGGIESGNDLVVSQLEDQFKIGSDHTFRAGLEYRYKSYKGITDSSAVFEYPHAQQNDYALNGTWLWQIDDKTSLTNAARIDRNDMNMGGVLAPNAIHQQAAYGQTYNTFSANSGLVHKLTDMDTLRATYGRGIQNPSEIESGFSNFLQLGALKLDVEGNPNIKPTVVDNYELGYDRKLPEIASTAQFSVYYEYNHDLKADALAGSLGTSPVGGGSLFNQNINVGDSHGWGGELALTGQQGGFHWNGSYSFQTIEDAALVAQTIGYAKSAPEHNFRLAGGYTTAHGNLMPTARLSHQPICSELRSQAQTQPMSTQLATQPLAVALGIRLTTI